MADGYQTIQEIERAIADLRGREEAIGRELTALNGERAGIMKQRTAAIRDLAETRTTSALADGVIDRADRLDYDVEAVLKARQKSIENLETRAREAAARHEALLREEAAGLATIAKLEDRIDGVAKQALEGLRDEPAFAELMARVDALATQRDKAVTKAKQAREDRVTKGKPYENDPLFMYLWNRNYRGDGYDPMSVIRLLDDWVADLVGYNAARANYAVLLEIPERLEAHVARLEADLTAAEAERDRLHAERIRELAGTDLVSELDAARGEQAEIDQRIGQSNTERAEISAQLNRYAEGLDEMYAAAVAKLAAFLERERYDRLMREARRTEDTKDDLIVERIGALRQQADEVAVSISRKRGEIEDLARRREELVRVAADFRRKSYHRPGSVFEPDFDMEDLLEDVLKGVLTVGEYWLRAQMRQRWSGRSGDPFRRSSGFPPFGRGKSRRSGAWGGRDFKTGGGF